MQQQWKPFSLTHVTYPLSSSSSSYVGQIFALLSLTPPFVVCALSTAVIYSKDVIALFLLVGGVLSAIVTSILKGVVKEPRPARFDCYDLEKEDEEEIEYGMPSNHSCFAFFIATWVVLYVLRSGGRRWAIRSLPSYYSTTRNAASVRNDGSINGNGVSSPLSSKSAPYKLLVTLYHHVHTTFTVCSSLLIAAECAYSRVYLQYHTPMQVCVGSIFGMVLGSIWYRIFETEGVRCMLIWLDGGLYELECCARRETMLCTGEESRKMNGAKDD